MSVRPPGKGGVHERALGGDEGMFDADEADVVGSGCQAEGAKLRGGETAGGDRQRGGSGGGGS
jgi:hypothetical protein